MVSVLAFISGVIRWGSSLTGPTESWAATKTGNTNGIAASNRFMGYSVFGSCSTVWDTRRERPDVLDGPPGASGSVHLVRSRARPTKFLKHRVTNHDRRIDRTHQRRINRLRCRRCRRTDARKFTGFQGRCSHASGEPHRAPLGTIPLTRSDRTFG